MEEKNEKVEHQSNENGSNPIAYLINAEGVGRGSGFFVEKNLIATNIHVVAGATSITAGLTGTGMRFTVEGVMAFDAKNDLVILKIAGVGTPLMIGDSDLVKNGDFLQTVGYPNGKYMVTEGPIHSIRDSDKWIRMKFNTLGGNSGGPVLNSKGEVIGIVVQDADFFSFAIPVNLVKNLLIGSQTLEPLSQWQEREQIRAYTYLVKSKNAKGRYEDAITNLDKAIQLSSNITLFYYNRGTIKSNFGQFKVEKGNVAEAHQHFQDAIDDFTKTINLCPDHAEAYNNRGVANSHLGQSKVESSSLTEAHQHFQDAIDDCTKAIKLCPDHAAVFNNRADAKYRFGKSEDTVGNMEASVNLFQSGIDDINAAIELDSNYAVFYHTRGQIKYELGDFCAAIEDCEKSCEIDPNYTDVLPDLELAKEVFRQ